MDDTDQILKEIYQEYASRLYAYGLQICPDKVLVEDALHDVFLDLLRNRKTFLKAENKRNYLFAAVRYKIYRQMRGMPEYLDINQTGMMADPSCEERLIEDEQARLQEALSKEMLASLTPRQREILYLRFVEKMHFQEIASFLSIAPQSAQNLFGRAIARLRKIFLSEKED
jgi:RNA polymerase sigma factor (sigma-70 family)